MNLFIYGQVLVHDKNGLPLYPAQAALRIDPGGAEILLHDPDAGFFGHFNEMLIELFSFHDSKNTGMQPICLENAGGCVILCQIVQPGRPDKRFYH